MNKKELIKDLIKSNLPEDTKTEAIHIIEQYYSGNTEFAVKLLVDLLGISSILKKFFCGD